MADTVVTLEKIDAFIAARHSALRFPDWLERQFEVDTAQQRARRLAANILPMCVVYNSLLIADWLLAYDQFWLSAILHFVVVTPYMALIFMIMKRSRAPKVREVAATTLPFSIVLQVLLIFHLSHYPYVSHYIYLILPPLLYASTIQRLLFPYAVGVSIASLLLQNAALLASEHTAWPIAIMASITIAACTHSALSSNYNLEREYRRTFLQRLRDRLRLAEADSASNRDALTGLANRRHLQKRSAEIWRDAPASHFPVAVVLLDIDHFKAYNDLYGHPAGDLCLKRVAACLNAELRDAKDLAVRYGGEEFLLLLPNTDLSDAERVAERIRGAIEALGIRHEGAPGFGRLTVSLGVSASTGPTLSAEELVAAADTALYEVKRRGRNHVRSPSAAFQMATAGARESLNLYSPKRLAPET